MKKLFDYLKNSFSAFGDFKKDFKICKACNKTGKINGKICHVCQGKGVIILK